MKPFIPPVAEHAVFGLLLSGLMTIIVSAISTWRVLGLSPALWETWLQAWLASWLIAFPAVLLLAPLVRNLVARVTVDQAESVWPLGKGE